MKLIWILVGLTMMGCAGGTSPAAKISTPVDATCKSVFSVWESTVDQERWDLTSFSDSVVTNADHEFRAEDGFMCGFKTNPFHTLEVQFYPRNLTRVQDPRDYNYAVALTYSSPMGGVCDRYAVAPGSLNHGAFMKVGCNEVSICAVDFASGALINCKTFN